MENKSKTQDTQNTNIILNDSNYVSWKIIIKQKLEGKGCWDETEYESLFAFLRTQIPLLAEEAEDAYFTRLFPPVHQLALLDKKTTWQRNSKKARSIITS